MMIHLHDVMRSSMLNLINLTHSESLILKGSLMSPPMIMIHISALLISISLMGCGSVQKHGRFSALSANAGDAGQLCEHKVPAEVCTRCDPAKAEMFKKVGDWCKPHKVPESQCYPCHPDLSFEPLPTPPPKGACPQAS